jgi:site-specific DNA-cytosine methylase
MPSGGKTAQSAMKFGVVDLFAGPGGLAEGFSAVTDSKGHFPFKIELSVEKEPAAHSTLLLRSFLRQFGRKFPEEYYTFLRQGGVEPDWRKLYPVEWGAANREAPQLELGKHESEPVLFARIKEVRQRYGDKTILIGGPPCQAYSLVGRARNGGIAGYVPEDDPKHTLYENYIKILTQLRPAAFVMETLRDINDQGSEAIDFSRCVLPRFRRGRNRRLHPLVLSDLPFYAGDILRCIHQFRSLHFRPDIGPCSQFIHSYRSCPNSLIPSGSPSSGTI